MKFANKENEKLEIVEDKYELFISKLIKIVKEILGIKPKVRTVWLSRAVAVVGTVCLVKDKTPYFLISQRGEGAADFHGLWNLPCGYLDWNETSGEAFIREVWEECGVDVKNIIDDKNISKLNLFDFPWDVNSSISENRQNVCLHHGIIAYVTELPVPEILNEVEEGEVADVKWVSIHDIENFEYAFNHLERVKKFISKHGLDFLTETETK